MIIMITYDGLRVLTMAKDDSRCCFGVSRPLLQPKISENETVCVFFFKARLMVMPTYVEIKR